MSRPSLVLVPAVVLTVLACGGLVNQAQNRAGEAIQEEIAEQIVKASSGEDVELELDKDKFTIAGKDGSLTFSGEGSATVPKDIPVSMPSDAKITASMDASGLQGSGAKSASTVMFETAQKPKDLGATWEKELNDKGYKVTKMDMSGMSGGGDMVIVSGEKGDEVISCTVAADEKGKVMGTVTKSQK